MFSQDPLVAGVEVVVDHIDATANIYSGIFRERPRMVEADDHIVGIDEITKTLAVQRGSRTDEGDSFSS